MKRINRSRQRKNEKRLSSIERMHSKIQRIENMIVELHRLIANPPKDFQDFEEIRNYDRERNEYREKSILGHKKHIQQISICMANTQLAIN